MVLHATGPWTQTIDVQVNRDGSWVSVGKSGSAEEKTPVQCDRGFQAGAHEVGAIRFRRRRGLL